MNYKFKFLNKEYKTYKELANALAANYGDAINYIFTKEFLDQFDDYYLRGRLEIEIKRCKYVESAFTMVIYLLDPELGLCVRGRFFKTLRDLAVYMEDTSSNKDISLIHLFEDNCLTHTLALNEEETLIKENILFIEDNINDSSIYEFFIDLFALRFSHIDAHGYTVFDYYLENVINEANTFDRFFYLVNNDIFKSNMYLKFGLKQMRDVYSARNTVIEVLRIIKQNSTINLMPILDKGIIVWLINNYKNYKFKGKARVVKKILKKARKEYRYIVDLDEKINYLEKLFYTYKDFINFYDITLIKPKAEEYSLTILKDRLRTATKYYNDYNIAFDFEAFRIELPQYEKKQIKLIAKHAYNQVKTLLDKEKIAKREKALEPQNYNKVLKRRFAEGIITSLVALASLVLIIFNFVNDSKAISAVFTYTTIASSALLLVLSLIYSIIYKRKLKINDHEFLSREFDFYLESKKNKSLGYKKVYRNNTFLRILIATTLGATVAYLTPTIMSLVDSSLEVTFEPYFIYIGLGVGFLVSVQFAGLKLKRYSYLLTTILTFIICLLIIIL